MKSNEEKYIFYIPENDDANNNSGRWSKDEDEQLRKAVEAIGPKNWRRISTEFLQGKRSGVQCIHRWQYALRPGLVKGPWTKDEDKIIIDCMKLGVTKWSKIAERIPGRIGRQCRNRWFNYLDPRIKKGAWSEEEDKILFELQNRMGNRWCEIAKLLPGRSEKAVTRRWNSRKFQAKQALKRVTNLEVTSYLPPPKAKERTPLSPALKRVTKQQKVPNVEVTSYLPPPKAKERTPLSPESNGTNLDDTGVSNENMPRQKQIIEEDATVVDDALSVNSSSDEDEDDDSDEDDQNAIVGQIYWCNGYEQVLV